MLTANFNEKKRKLTLDLINQRRNIHAPSPRLTNVRAVMVKRETAFKCSLKIGNQSSVWALTDVRLLDKLVLLGQLKVLMK